MAIQVSVPVFLNICVMSVGCYKFLLFAATIPPNRQTGQTELLVVSVVIVLCVLDYRQTRVLTSPPTCGVPGNCLSSPVLDASGKPGRGLLEGNTHMHGNYDQCKDISYQLKNVNRDIKGRYCGAEIQLPPGVLPPAPGEVSAFTFL